MKATYIYKSAFGDSLLTITGKSAARGRDSVRNLRWERTQYIDRIADLSKSVKNLRKAIVACRNHARKERDKLLAEIARLQDEALEARCDSDKVESLSEENTNLCAEVERLQEAYESLSEENAGLCAEMAHCRIDRRKWYDIAERCFAAAMKNAVALADEHKRGV